MFSIEHLFILIFTLILLPTSNSSPDKIVDNFQEFASDLGEAFFTCDKEPSDTLPGVQLLNSFGVGLSLATIHENVWNISSLEIPHALKTDGKYTPTDYGYLLGLFKKSKIKITNTLYTRYGNITNKDISPSLQRHVIAVDYIRNPAQFVDSFSSLENTATKGHLDNELFPKGLWEKVLDKFSQGAYINTMHYKAKHVNPWKEIGKKKFAGDSDISFLEVEGNFPVYQTENITAVIVDIGQVPPKQIIFAKSHTFVPVSIFRQQLQEILISESFFKVKKVKVQIPALNMTNLSRHNLGFTKMDINLTFCNMFLKSEGSKNAPEFVQQPITQANHFQFESDFIEIASATGTIVALNNGAEDTDHEDEYDDNKDITSILMNEGETESERTSLQFPPRFKDIKTKYSLSTGVLLQDLLKTEEGLPLFSLPAPSSHLPRERSDRTTLANKRDCGTFEPLGKISGVMREDEYNVVTFDTPFAFSLKDQVIGESFFGFVSSLCSYQTVVNSFKTSSENSFLQDVFKVAFWKCY